MTDAPGVPWNVLVTSPVKDRNGYHWADHALAFNFNPNMDSVEVLTIDSYPLDDDNGNVTPEGFANFILDKHAILGLYAQLGEAIKAAGWKSD